MKKGFFLSLALAAVVLGGFISPRLSHSEESSDHIHVQQGQPKASGIFSQVDDGCAGDKCPINHCYDVFGEPCDAQNNDDTQIKKPPIVQGPLHPQCVNPDGCGPSATDQDSSIDSENSGDSQVADNTGTDAVQGSTTQGGSTPMGSQPVSALVSGGGCSVITLPLAGGGDAVSWFSLALFIGLPLWIRRK